MSMSALEACQAFLTLQETPRTTPRSWALYGRLGAAEHPVPRSTPAVSSAELRHDLLGHVLHDGSYPRHVTGVHCQHNVVYASILVGAEAGDHLLHAVSRDTGAVLRPLARRPAVGFHFHSYRHGQGIRVTSGGAG